MPAERAQTPQSHTTISMGNSSEDRNSERSDSIATVEIFRSEGDPESAIRTPSQNTEDTECGNVSRHRATPNIEDNKKFASKEIPEVPLERKKSNGISKGVILNAMNFGSYDLKCPPKDPNEMPPVMKDQELFENGSLSPKALEASSENNLKATEAEKDKEKKKMSLPRKIAFGFSFLPSVMFVLTFAVILPCDVSKVGEKCVIQKWSRFLNQTEITSYLGLPESLLLGYQIVNNSVSSDGLFNLNEETGSEIWRLPMNSFPKLLECRNIDLDANQDGVKDCLTVLENGNVCAFNLSDSYVFWTFHSNQANEATVLLSGCPYYNDSKPVAVVSYDSEYILGIDVLQGTNGSLLTFKQVKLPEKCSTFNMKSWEHDNETDLVFFCKNRQGVGYILRVKQNLWCPSGGEEEKEQNIMELMRFNENEIEPTYLPTTEGILVWTHNQVAYLQSDGTEKWKDETRYVLQNKILKFGSFYAGGQQVALIGQNSSGIVVSILTSKTGKELSMLSVPNGILNQVVVLQGHEIDTLLISVLKTTEAEKFSDKEVVLLSNVSLSDFRTDVPYEVNGNRSIVEQFILFQFEGKNTTHVVLENEIPVSCETEAVCEPESQATHIISAFSEVKEKSLNLKIIMLRTLEIELPEQNGSQYGSQLTALYITPPDNTVSGQTACTL